VNQQYPYAPIATHTAWKTEPIPEASIWLPYAKYVSPEDYQRITYGLIPREMEDKWFIFLEDQTLFMYRSWTGYCIYQVLFEINTPGYRSTRIWVNRNLRQYNNTDNDYDLAVVDFLIDGLLLHKPVTFPLPSNLPPNLPVGLYQHHSAGTAYPEQREQKVQPRYQGNWLIRTLYRLLKR
jgi:hypothetical protein